MKSDIQAASGQQRVYEYESPDGVLYYSFTKHEATVSKPLRLRLRGRIGIHLLNFITELRQAAKAWGVEEDEDAG